MAEQTQFQAGIETAFRGLPRHCHLPLHTTDRSAWQEGYDLAIRRLVQLRDSMRDITWEN